MSIQFAVTEYGERRRSPRISARLPLVVCDHGQMQEQTCTLSVSGHGILVPLAAGLRIGQGLVVHNPENWAERHARVTRLGHRYGGRTEVGIEFTESALDFWLIDTTSQDARLGQQKTVNLNG